MRAVLDVLLPPACAGCGVSGALLCRTCARSLPPSFDPADRFAAADAGVVVGDEFAVAIAAFAYAGAMRKALVALKYTGASRLAAVLARPALPALRRVIAISGPAALVPVPVHEERRRIRGYNQADLLAKELAGIAGLPLVDLLLRTRATTKQHRLNRTARLANLRGAFEVREGLRVPQTLILVDDIITTTATLEACASVARAGGAEEVYALAIAREV